MHVVSVLSNSCRLVEEDGGVEEDLLLRAIVSRFVFVVVDAENYERCFIIKL
jgi:hypothetical protein